MSSVDERVVRMRFDSTNFEPGAAKALSIMEKLQTALKFKNGSDGLNAIQKTSNGFNMNGVTSSIEIVTSRFSMFQEFVTGVFRRLGERALDFGVNIVKGATIKPLMDGFSEYETQMKSIQTISANTGLSGDEGIAKINAALDELNTYADKTIYNFSEMTRNIGTFTAAGVDLDTSAKAIQGIANLAAVSGSTSQQASIAMYQLSQALASGTVKLQDWNSVVNAGMGGKVFQEALKRTARAHGEAVDDMIAKTGSFRESLKEGWLTTDVLTDTLNQLAITYEEVGDDAYNAAMQKLLDSNYSKEDAEAILELAKTAEEAATMVRTWSQLWETVGEALGSGWATSWRIIVGDFNQATEFFTWASTKLSDIINQSSDARNKFLTEWAEAGGRQGVINIIANSFKALEVVVSAISKAFNKVFGSANATEVANFILHISEMSEKLVLSDQAAKYLSGTFRIIFRILKGGLGTLRSVAGYVGSLLSAVVKALHQANAFRRLAKIADNFLSSFGKIVNAIGSAFKETFSISEKTSGYFSTFIGRALRLMENFSKSLTVTDSFAKKLHDTFKSLFEGIKNGENPVKNLGDFLYNSISGAFKKLKTFNLTDWLSKNFESIDFEKVFNSVGTVVIGVTLADVVSKISEFVKNLKKEDDKASPFDKINGVLDGIGSAISDFQEKVKFDKIKEIGKALGILAASLLLLSFVPSDKIGPSLVALAGAIGELFLAVQLFSMFGKMKKLTISTVITSLAVSLLAISAAVKIMSTISWEGLGKGLIGVGASIAFLTTALNFMPDKGKLHSSSKAIKRLATSMLILSVAMKVLSTITWEGIGKGLSSVAGLLTVLVVAINNMPDSGRLLSSSVSIMLISVSLVALSAALVVLSALSWEGIAKGLVAICTSLAALTIALNNMPDSGRLLSSSVAMVLISVGLGLLSGAISVLANLGWEGIAKGLVSVCVLLSALTIALNNMPDSGRLLSSSIAILLISAGLTVLSNSIISLSSLSWEGLAKGIVAVCVSLAALTIALNLMPDSGRLLSSAISIIIISAAFMNFASVITQMSALSWEGIAKGLVSIAGLLVVIGIALAAMQSNLLGAASLFIVSSGLTALAGAIKMLGSMPVSSIVLGILTMAGAIGAICLAAFLAKPAIPFLVAIAASLALIGLSAASIIGAVDGATQALSDLLGPAKEAGANLINGLVAGVTGYAGKLIESALAAGKAFFSSICGFFGIQSPSTVMADVGRNIVQGLINGIGEFLGGLGTKALEIGQTVLNGVTELPGKLAEKASEGMTWFVNGIGGFFGAAGQKGTEIATSVGDGVSALAGNLRTKASNGMDAFSGAIQAKIGTAKSKAEAVKTSVVNGFNTLASGMRTKASEGVNAFVGAISNGAGRARSAASSLCQAAKNGLSNLWSHFHSVGSDAVSGFIGGLTSRVGQIASAAANMVSTAINAARAKADSHSPSRVFMAIGGDTGDGYAIGIIKSIPTVAKATSSMAEAGIDSFNDSLRAMSFDMDDLIETDYNPVITPVIDPTSFDSDLSMLSSAMNSRFSELSIGNLNYTGELSAKISDANDLNRQTIDAISRNGIDYDRLGVSVANALIRSGLHVELDGDRFMGYLAGEIADARRQYVG